MCLLDRLKLLHISFEPLVHLCRQSYDGLKSQKHEQRERNNVLFLPVTATDGLLAEDFDTTCSVHKSWIVLS